jgi:hypothetical protein
MSYLLTRIRRVLAEPPKEKATHAVLLAINAHWKSLYANDPTKLACMGELLKEMEPQINVVVEADQNVVNTQLALWEARRAAYQLDTTLGGPPGSPGMLSSGDWATHWILFHWSEPETGAPVWVYRIERSADNREFYPVEVCVNTEVTLLNQPQDQKFYYRVVPFNGFGDGPPSGIFGVKFDAELVDHRKRNT